MSIEYFVEGKVTMRFKGDYTLKSKGNIIHNAKEVIQQGDAGGVSYGRPEKINPDDKPTNTIDITLNLFFDGTLNNKTNVDIGRGKEKMKGSYANEYSNVVRGYDAVDPTADNQVKVYVEGIGTVNEQSDYTAGKAFGTGNTGIKAKVTKGCVQAAEKIYDKSVPTRKVIDVLLVNVFGFSRGAAAARHFIHVSSIPASPRFVFYNKYAVRAPSEYELSAEEKKESGQFIGGTDLILTKKQTENPLLAYGFFGACLAAKGIEVKRIRFNFAGLYDTVAAYGLAQGSSWFYGNDSDQLHLNAVSKAAFVFQIASADEYRGHFSLTNIASAGNRGLEVTLPGVHSDIGGGYVEGAEEKVMVFGAPTKWECQKMKQILIDEGWYDTNQLKIIQLDSTYFTLEGARNSLHSSYDRIPLNLMFHYSKQFKIIYKQTIESDHKIPNDLQPAWRQLATTAGYVGKCTKLYQNNLKASKENRVQYREELNKVSYLDYLSEENLRMLRHRYFHWSANLDEIGMAPNGNKAVPFTQRKRNVLQG